MNLASSNAAEALWLTKGNQKAADFLHKWKAYVHGIDDIVDGDIKTAEETIAVFMHAAFLYADPFYLEHLPRLHQIVVNCTNAYADSVAWEKSEVEWQRNFSDHFRHFAAEMVLAVAFICGGYHHMRQVSLLIRLACWEEHHDETGGPI
jgi:hypothetical protein